jgi:hypothetical protein
MIFVNCLINKTNKKQKINKCSFALAFSVFLTVVFILGQVWEISFGASATDSVILSTTVAETISLDCGTDVNLGTLTPGTPVTGSSTCTVTTNANGGYNLQVKRDDADTTMDKTTDATTNIADKTAWDPTGSGNGATWTGTGLGFTVFASTATKSTTWWGTGTTETDANNKYAGFPTAYTNVMVHTAYSSSSTTNSIGYKLDVPSTQKSGAYDGTITFQAVSTP